jgi:hypothetical protein
VHGAAPGGFAVEQSKVVTSLASCVVLDPSRTTTDTRFDARTVVVDAVQRMYVSTAYVCASGELAPLTVRCATHGLIPFAEKYVDTLVEPLAAVQSQVAVLGWTLFRGGVLPQTGVCDAGQTDVSAT